MECFDRWDKSPGPANDTEIHLTAWFVGVGIALTLAEALRYVPRLVRTGEHSHRDPLTMQVVRQWASDSLEPTGSPPLISLRI